MKGFACVIVIMVHFPLAYQNKLQDAIGSFAYVAVTIFFMISAFGMAVNAEKNHDYLKNFWWKRLSTLLIPQLMTNVIIFLILGLDTKSLFHLNNYVLTLICYCIVFYLVVRFRKFYSRNFALWLLSAIVIASSLLSYFLLGKSGNDSYWCFERWGLVWGLVLFACLPKVKKAIAFSPMKFAIVAVVALILGVGYLMYKPVYFWGEYLLKVMLGLAIIIFIFVTTSKLKLGNAVINFLGDISYEVYLLHGGIMIALAKYCPSLSSGIFIFITIGITIATAALAHFLDKRITHILLKSIVK